MKGSLLCLLVCLALASLSLGQDPQKTYEITTIELPPFMTYSERSGDGRQLSGNDRFKGYMKDLINRLANRITINYELKLVKDGKFGMLSKGSWNGMVGEIIRREAAIAAGPLTVNSMRARVLDLSPPFMTSSLGIAMKADNTGTVDDTGTVVSNSRFFLPFTGGLLACIVLCIIVVVIVFYLITRFDPYERRSKPGANDVNGGVMGVLWLVCGGLVLQGYTKRPNSVAAFILLGFWWSFCVILFATFVSSLLRTEKTAATPQKTARGKQSWSNSEVIEDSSITLLAVNDSSTVPFLCAMRDNLYRKACAKLVLVNSVKEGVDKVKAGPAGAFAMLLDTPTIRYEGCSLVQVGDSLNDMYYGLATPINSPLGNHIILSLLEMRENGDLDKLEEKYWGSRPSCESPVVNQPMRAASRVTLTELKYLFIFFLVGIILAAIAMAIEVLYFRYKKKKSTPDETVADADNKAADGESDQHTVPLDDKTAEVEGDEAIKYI